MNFKRPVNKNRTEKLYSKPGRIEVGILTSPTSNAAGISSISSLDTGGLHHRRRPAAVLHNQKFYAVASCSSQAAFIARAFYMAASLESFLVLPRWTVRTFSSPLSMRVIWQMQERTPPSAILRKSVSNDPDFCNRSKYQPVTYSRPEIADLSLC